MVHVKHRGCLPAWICTSDQSWLRGIVPWNPHRELAAACWAHKGPGGLLTESITGSTKIKNIKGRSVCVFYTGRIWGPGPKFWVHGTKFEPRGPILGPWAQIWAHLSRRGPRAGAPSFPNDYFWKQGPGSSPRRLLRKSCPPRPPKPSQRVRLEKLACLKFIWLGDLWICPFRGPKPFVSHQNGKMQVAGFSGF